MNKKYFGWAIRFNVIIEKMKSTYNLLTPNNVTTLDLSALSDKMKELDVILILAFDLSKSTDIKKKKIAYPKDV